MFAGHAGSPGFNLQHGISGAVVANVYNLSTEKVEAEGSEARSSGLQKILSKAREGKRKESKQANLGGKINVGGLEKRHSG